MAYENDEISWTFVKLAALRYLRGLSAGQTHLANVASPQKRLFGHYSNILFFPKTAKTERNGRRFAVLLLVQSEAILG